MKSKLICLLALAAAAHAAPVDVSVRAQVTSANPKSTLDRASNRITSAVEVTVKNIGDRALGAPVEAVIDFTAISGALPGLLVPAAQGGPGIGPHGAFFYDLTAQLPGGALAAGASVTFTLRFTPPANTRVTFAVRLFAELNNDPVAVAGGPYAGRVGQAITFDSTGTQDPDGDPITLEWNFGDRSALSAEAAPSHTYARAGRYEAALPARDNRGGQKTLRVPVLISPAAVYGVARVRSLDGAGQPLGGVDVIETRAGASRNFTTAAGTGFASLGHQPGNYKWQFSKAGFLTVCRTGTLMADDVDLLPSPWLTRLNTAPQQISPLAGALIDSPNETISLTFPAGAFLQPAELAITELNAQSLPSPLPAGWSPLAEFHFATTEEPMSPGEATVRLAGPAPSGVNVVAVRFDAAAMRWDCTAVQAGGSSTVAMPVTGSGSYAIVVPDAAPTAPPDAEAGQPLAGTTAPVNLDGVTATGTVTPEVAAASRDADLVTASARATFTTASPVPSGVAFPTRISETYKLAPSGSTRTPDYDTTVFAYRRPAGALAADFPLRPQLLLGSDELQQATVHVEVLDAVDSAFGVLDQDGGVITSDGVTVTVPGNGNGGPQVVELNTLDAQSFSGLLGGSAPARAFDLSLAAGQTFAIAFDGLEAGARCVLGSVVSDGARRGVTPVERFLADASGDLVSEEPASGERLPGPQGGGQYVLVKVPAPLGIVSGIARDAGGQPAGGLAVTVDGQPWLVFSKADGSYQILAPLGTALVSVDDGSNGNSGSATANVTDVGTTTNADVTTAPTGPRVASTVPKAGATNARVVAPIVVRFSKAIAPGSFGAAGVTLAKSSGGAVDGSLSLNLANTIATYLPINPLEPSTAYTVTVADTIRDRQNLPIEGNRIFSFTTATPDARGEGAQLVIYEPGAANVPQAVLDQLVGYTAGAGSSHVVAQGSGGTADPGVAVILVNETTGETATVLSRPDGSFANFIDAAAEDFVSATFVNANDTRVSIPATRQIFDDGRVGLYRGGGILEAESDGGPVQVLIQPEAVTSRSVFKVEALGLAEILSFLNGVTPQSGQLVGSGLRVTVEGDEVRGDSELSFPLDPSGLQLAPGVPVEEAAFALTVARQIEGQTVFQVVDKMRYEDGKLFTNTAPFEGVFGNGIVSPEGLAASFGGAAGAIASGVFQLVLMPLFLQGKPVTVTGQVAQLPESTVSQLEIALLAEIVLSFISPIELTAEDAALAFGGDETGARRADFIRGSGHERDRAAGAHPAGAGLRGERHHGLLYARAAGVFRRRKSRRHASPVGARGHVDFVPAPGCRHGRQASQKRHFSDARQRVLQHGATARGRTHAPLSGPGWHGDD